MDKLIIGVLVAIIGAMFIGSIIGTVGFIVTLGIALGLVGAFFRSGSG